MRRRIAAIVLPALAMVVASAAAAADAELIEAGEMAYDTNCSTCHGIQLRNNGLTFDLRRLRADERARFENSVLNGKNQMPPWRGVLEKRDLDAIWAFIRANADK